MGKLRPIHLGKKGYKKLWPIMSDEERRRRNGDKNAQPGYTSSGVKLPSKEELNEYHEGRKQRRNQRGMANLSVKPSRFVIHQNMGHKK